MPCKQRLRRDDVRDLGQSTSAQFFRADGKPSPLIVGKVESPVTDLFTKDAILFGEVVDNDLLMLIEPASEAGKKERKRIEKRWHGQMLSPGLVSPLSALSMRLSFCTYGMTAIAAAKTCRVHFLRSTGAGIPISGRVIQKRVAYNRRHPCARLHVSYAGLSIDSRETGVPRPYRVLGCY